MQKTFETLEGFFNYRLPLIAVTVFLLFFILWACFSSIDQQVSGVGRIIPAGKSRVIQHLEGGIVDEILVHEGQQVAPDQALFTISNSRAKSDLQEIYVDVKALEIRQKRLQAELAGEETVVFDKELNDNYKQIIEAELMLFHSRKRETEEKIKGINERLRQKKLKLEDLRARLRNLSEESEIAQRQNAIKKKLHESGASSESQYLDTQSQVKNFETRMGEVEKEIPITEAEYTEVVNLIEETKQNVRSAILDDLNKVNIELKKYQERVVGAKDQVARTTIKSPIKGIVNKVNINTIGGVIAPGQVVAEIIPLDEALVVEGMLSTDDRGKVWPSLPVKVKVKAYDYSIYGGIDGVLTQVSADSLIDGKGQEFYRINVDLKSNKLPGDKVLYPGMMVDLNILTGKVSVMQALLRPLLHIRDTALREQD